MRPIIIFIALCIVKESIQEVKFYEEKATPVNQILCVKTALKKYFNDHTSVLLYSTNARNIVIGLPNVSHFVTTEWDSVRKVLSAHAGPMIMFLEGKVEQDFDSLKRLRGFTMVQPVLIVCITDAACGSEMYVNEIIKFVDGSQLHYVAMDDRGIIDIYEYTTTAEGNCDVAQLVRRGHCSERSTAEKVFETSLNFHECPLRVVIRPYPMVSEPLNPEESTNFYGVEGGVMRIVADKINATPVSFEVESVIDLRRLVSSRYVDLGFGKLHVDLHDGISYSIPYLFVEGTVVLPYSTEASRGLLGNILLPLEFKVWVGVGVVIASIFILRILIPHFRRIYALQLFGMLIGISVPRQPRGLPGRIYFLSFVLFSFFFSESYLTNLTKVLSSPRQQMIENLDDLEKSSLRVTGSFEVRQMFKEDYSRIDKDFDQVDDMSEYKAKLNAVLKGHSNSVVYVEYIMGYSAQRKELTVIKDQISWYPVSMAVPNSSRVLSTIDKILTSTMESGIVNKLSLLATRKRLSRPKGSTSFGSAKVLKLEELQGLFILMIIGLSISFLVFLIEITTPIIKTKVGLMGGSKIRRELSSGQVHGILLPRQTSRAHRH